MVKRPTKQVTVPPADDAEPELGPAMRALLDRQRAFVSFFVAEPPGRGAATNAARKAGYGNAKTSALSYAQIAYRLLNDSRIIAAVAEQSRALLRSGAPAAAKALLDLLADKEHKDHARAIGMVIDRIDPAVSQHQVVVEHHDEAKMIQATIRLARELGVPVSQLLGPNFVMPASLVIEGEATEVKAVAEPAKPIERRQDWSALGFSPPTDESEE